MDAMYILDASVFLMLTVLANLSRRIGDALQIPPHYKLFSTGSILLLTVVIADIASGLFWGDTAKMITVALRALIAAVAVPICFRYWYWLFNENVSRK